MPRFFEDQKLALDQVVRLNEDNSHKIRSVLRLKKDHIIILFNNTNFEFQSQIINIKSKFIEVKIINAKHKDLSSLHKIHLVTAITKNDNFDLVIQKSTELGVNEITPIITERTVVKYNSNKILHWNKIAIAACCQCGRNNIPKINEITSFTNIVEKYNEITTTHKLIFSPLDFQEHIKYKNTDKILNFLLPLKNINGSRIIILIGPEGGFTLNEIDKANKNLFSVLQLGARILRAETAAIAIVSILQAALGDL